jgi:hypothetical protein
MKIENVIAAPIKITACFYVKPDKPEDEVVYRFDCPLLMLVTHDSEVDSWELLSLYYADGFGWEIADQEENFLGFEMGAVQRDWGNEIKIQEQRDKRRMDRLHHTE